MGTFKFTVTGSTKRTEQFLKKMSTFDVAKILAANGQRGVNALAAATPIESGLAQHSYSYEVKNNRTSATITWTNSDVENGFPVVIMLQYGYATGTGGYVRGRDFINPAIRPIFDLIEEEVWKVVTSA